MLTESLYQKEETPTSKFFTNFGFSKSQTPTFNHILTAFEYQARLNPQNVAVIHNNQSLTYGELNYKANVLAKTLINKGVMPGDRVGLFVRRSLSMVEGILAILKAGAAYVPQDVKISPVSQLTFVIRQAKLNVVLTQSEFQHRVPVFGDLHCLSIDRQKVSGDTHFVKPLRRPQDPCFVLFTSGTTGKPNGVEVTHKNLANILQTDPGRLGMKPGVKVSQILNIAFDMAAWETLGALSNGATLVIRQKDFEETLKQVDVVIATPSILASLNADKLQNVKTVAVAGEPCPKPLADKWSQFAEFYNSCGPTEVTIVNTMKRYHGPNDKLTIGVPTPNNTVYILNENREPCKRGEIGEMWAGGDCVSNGYIGNAKLTEERYKPDPYLGGGRKMFRTRDLGRWTEDGEIEHFGRTDDQVKIRGFRVELDSVSTVLESSEQCQQAVTLKLNDRDLVSFVRPGHIDVQLLRESIQDELPYYCKPAVVIALDEFPKTDRGKIDKRALTILAVNHKEGR